jgi:rSAM/selenodomain-associated transferase 1
VTHIIVMAKAPLAGYAKTRLIVALGAEGAARLAAQLLDRAMQSARGAGLGPVWLACAPDTAHAAFIAHAGAAEHGGAVLIAQGGGGLGARMHRVFTQAFEQGASRVLLLGTDAPAIGAAMLRQADAALAADGIGAVFVPAHDGGYALVGLKQPQFELFDDMPWSTPQVMAATRERLAQARLRAIELPAVHDIDEPADLPHLPAGWLQGLRVPPDERA